MHGICLLTHLIPSAESLIDKAIELKAIGGVYGNNKPTDFMCLLLKLLQIQPEKEILLEYLQADEFKCVRPLTPRCIDVLFTQHRYLRALAAIYIRMTFHAAEVYDILEPLLKDYRKIRYRNSGMSLFVCEMSRSSSDNTSRLPTYPYGRVCRFFAHGRACLRHYHAAHHEEGGFGGSWRAWHPEEPSTGRNGREE